LEHRWSGCRRALSITDIRVREWLEALRLSLNVIHFYIWPGQKWVQCFHVYWLPISDEAKKLRPIHFNETGSTTHLLIKISIEAPARRV
jgi:hypothetical protein